MSLVVVGLLNKQVGSCLGISEITVKKYRGNAMRDMKTGSLVELAKMDTRLRLPRALADNVVVASRFSFAAAVLSSNKGGSLRPSNAWTGGYKQEAAD